jgi:hypothetical protein
VSPIPWLDYVRLGKLVYRLLRAHFPELAKVPIADVLNVVEELLKTSASLQDVAVIPEPQASAMKGRAPAPIRPEYRLVVKGRGPR